VKVLLVNPKFPQSYWDLDYALPLLGVGYFQPSLPLLTVAALLPEHWSLRLLDENVELVTDDDISKADVVMLTAMIAQRDALWKLLERCRALGVITVVGGPYVTSTPETVPAEHIVAGEGENIIPILAHDLENGTAKPLYHETGKPSLDTLPPPRYDLLNLDAYGDMVLQFSRGCPFQCEFCDIIVLYGRSPRTKSLDQIIAELDRIYATGFRGDVNFVDDNFIGNKKAVKQVLPGVTRWQEERGFPFNFYTEASMNLAEDDELIDLMVDAGFKWVFVGVETPSEESLRETKKFQNLKSDLAESIHHINRRGLLVVAGFILGFDNDGEDIFERIIRFVGHSRLAIAMVGQIVAVPRTPLYERLKREGRLRDIQPGDAFGPTNVMTKLPPPVMVRGYRRVIEQIYEPSAYFERCRSNLEIVEPRGPNRKLNARDVMRILRSLWFQGVKSGYRGVYWRFILWALFRFPSKIRFTFLQAIFGHHFIRYSAETVVPRLHQVEKDVVAEELLQRETAIAM
jgi:radical SAM superfamily enzyme YgiQ (UPF0313 family)